MGIPLYTVALHSSIWVGLALGDGDEAKRIGVQRLPNGRVRNFIALYAQDLDTMRDPRVPGS